jgi:hypothetical protein
MGENQRSPVNSGESVIVNSHSPSGCRGHGRDSSPDVEGEGGENCVNQFVCREPPRERTTATGDPTRRSRRDETIRQDDPTRRCEQVM